MQVIYLPYTHISVYYVFIDHKKFHNGTQSNRNVINSMKHYKTIYKHRTKALRECVYLCVCVCLCSSVQFPLEVPFLHPVVNSLVLTARLYSMFKY